VLDLGANPYILTYALVRMGARVVASGHPAPDQPLAAGEEWVEFDGPAIRCRVPLYRFNVELDRFPFADASFDVVICGELVEHLPNGPDRLLYECNRVLVDGGRLLLSTPNAVSLARLMAIARGVNPDWPFSPQGLYARHNRLYTFGELHDLLEGTGFRPLREKGLSFRHQRSWYGRSPAGWAKWALMAGIHGALARQPYRLRRLAEGVLVAAMKVGPPRTYRPEWLFGSADGVPMVAEGAPAEPEPAPVARIRDGGSR
jgi:SAM-dependent methyltransferase